MFTESSHGIGYSNKLALNWLAWMNLSEIARANFVYWMKNEGRQQKWVAQQLGVTENTVSRWKSGKLDLSLAQIGKIAELMKIPVPALLIEGGAKSPQNALRDLADKVSKT